MVQLNCEVPTAFRIRGTVIFRIFLEVIMCSGYAAGVVYLVRRYEIEFRIPDNVIKVLAVAVGMLLVFRTNTSYDRFWEGRKLWSELTSHVRTLVRTFWVMIDSKDDPRLIIEKISAVNLLIAFAYATKHYLREEYSYEESDLIAIAGHLPQFFTPTTLQQSLDEQEKLLSPGQNELRETEPQPSDMQNYISLKKSVEKLKNNYVPFHGDKEHPLKVGSNIPLEISYLLSGYVKSCKDRSLIDASTARMVDIAIDKMMTCLTAFERIRSTAIPVAYRVHLTQVTWIVLFTLPFDWVDQLGYESAFVMTITSFAMLGILGIGREIEDPFGYDYNDLNLDDYCRVIHKEAIAIIAQPMPKISNWMLSDENHPIASFPELTAKELVRMSPADITKNLFAGRRYKFRERSQMSTRTRVAAHQHIP